MEDLQELRPTMFCGVPRMYDRIYTGIANKVSSSGALRKMLFQYAYNYKLANLEKGLPQENAAPLLDKLVFDKKKQALGGRVRILLSGAAPLPRHVEEFSRVTTCRTLSQGYGDIGELQPNGAMKIIDRKKNIFKLSQGEYVAVENIESKYLQCPLITSIWVYGNSFESFLVAVVVPDRKALEDWAAKHHLADDFKSLCQNLKARKYILDELNSVGQKQQLRGFELLKAVHLEPNPFDMERDLITPTFKLKRPHQLKYYKDRITVQ